MTLYEHPATTRQQLIDWLRGKSQPKPQPPDAGQAAPASATTQGEEPPKS